MKKQISSYLIALVTAVSIAASSMPAALAANDDPLNSPTLVNYKNDYAYQKIEPVKGNYLGAYVLQDEYIDKDMLRFNEVTGKQHASFFRYVGYGKPFPKAWVEEVKAAGAIPHIAFEPNNGLDAVQDDEYLKQWAIDARDSGVPIFLRFASEMNGTWTQYSGKSDLYKAKWRMVHSVFNKIAPNVAFVWTVFTFPESTIEKFYPGDKYVDWVGVNIYNVIYHNDNARVKADHEDPLELLDYVYNKFSHAKPIQISEFGASHFNTTDGKYYISFAQSKIRRMYQYLPMLYPRVKSIFYFDVNNLVNAPEGRKINDYSVTNDPNVLATYSKWTNHEHYLNAVPANLPYGTVGKEKMTYRGFMKTINEELYVNIEYFEKYLDLPTVKGSNGIYVVGDAKASVRSKRVTLKTNFGITRTFTMLPLRQAVTPNGYTLNVDKASNIIHVAKVR